MSCGWQLRGTTIPMPPFSLETDNQTTLALKFVEALEFQGAKMVSSATTELHLKVTSIDFEKKPVMLDNLGNVSKIQLSARIKFSFLRGESVLIAEKLLQSSKEYTFDETAVLAKEKEDSLNQQSVFQDLATRTLLILRSTQKNGGTAP